MRHDSLILRLVDREQWERAEHDALPSQCWRYADALRFSGLDPSLAVIHSGGSHLLMPFVERAIGDDVDIATTPGLSGASIVPASAAPLEAWTQVASSRKWVCGYIQLAPASYPNVPEAVTAVHQTHAFMIDPSVWTRRTASEIIRRKVAAALREGARISDDRAALAARLTTLYPAMLARFAAESLLSAETILAWSADPRNLIVGVSVDGHIEGVHLVHVHGDRAEFHLAGMSPRGRTLSALLYVTVLERLGTMGVRRLNLGGGGNPGDGLYTFKTWLGATPVPLQSIRQIYDPGRYEALCRATSIAPDSRWFPAYRTPHPKGTDSRFR